MVAVDQKNHDDQDYNQSSSWSANKDQQLCVDGWVIQEFRFLWKKETSAAMETTKGSR